MDNYYTPIRALYEYAILFFQNLNDDFLKELQNEVQFNSFSGRIRFDESRKPIECLAEINPDGTIILYTSYLEFLWTLSYLNIVYYEEHNDPNFEQLDRAHRLFAHGIGLLKEWRVWESDLPNPHKPDLERDLYVGQTNPVWAAATSYILAHEYSHHYLGHDLEVKVLSQERAVEEEYAADKNALGIFKDGMGRDQAYDHTCNIGIVVGICSLLFTDGSWEAESGYPDTGERVFALMNDLSPTPEHENWIFGISTLTAWAIINNRDDQYETSGIPKDDFITLLALLRNAQCENRGLY